MNKDRRNSKEEIEQDAGFAAMTPAYLKTKSVERAENVHGAIGMYGSKQISAGKKLNIFWKIYSRS